MTMASSRRPIPKIRPYNLGAQNQTSDAGQVSSSSSNRTGRPRPAPSSRPSLWNDNLSIQDDRPRLAAPLTDAGSSADWGMGKDPTDASYAAITAEEQQATPTSPPTDNPTYGASVATGAGSAQDPDHPLPQPRAESRHTRSTSAGPLPPHSSSPKARRPQGVPVRPKMPPHAPHAATEEAQSTKTRRQGRWTDNLYIAIALCVLFYGVLVSWPFSRFGSPGLHSTLNGAESELSVRTNPYQQSLRTASNSLASWEALKDQRTRVDGLASRATGFQSQQRHVIGHYRRLYSRTLKRARGAGDCQPLIDALRVVSNDTKLLISQHASINSSLKAIIDDFREDSNTAYRVHAAWDDDMRAAYSSIRDVKQAFLWEPYSASDQLILGIIEQLTGECSPLGSNFFRAWSTEQKDNKQVIDGVLPRLDENTRLLLSWE
ncbi:hypothetical protein PV04_09760 [Phialophora macrospora]|uniref:Uncharacterized protein n=1 Tax=Phialophora macrospora TaxID=1851006 RepID=A0A0D2F4Q3_9EURO|nr:hypothetical protein PV04_09760 [Phialophora macrospora]